MGITSRDLGTVLGKLANNTPMAEKAIIAFGLEAGPGLRTLIGAGTAGVEELRAKLAASKGAAEDAAAAMQQNLKGAFGDLGSTWDAIKGRIGEGFLPALEREIRALSTQLRAWLASGQLEQIRAGLVTAFESAAAAVRTFITEFDLQQLMTRISAFGQQSGAVFAEFQARLQTLAEVTTRVLSALSLLWNGFRGTVETTGQAFTGLAANVVSAYSQIVQAAAKLHLADQQTADGARRVAEGLKQASADFANAASASYARAGDAFTRMTETQQSAAANASAAANTVTVAVAAQSQAVGLTAAQLDALGAAGNFAAAGQSQFAETTKAATATTEAATAATRAEALEVDGAAVAVTNLTTASKTHAEAEKEELLQLDLLIKAQQAELQILSQATNLIEAQGRSRLTHIGNLRDEAQAIGDCNEVERLALTLTDETIAAAQQAQQAKQAEADAALALAESLKEQAQAQRDTSTATKAAVTAAEQSAKAMQQQAADAAEVVRHEQAMAAAARAAADSQWTLEQAFTAAGKTAVRSMQDVRSAIQAAATGPELEALGKALEDALRQGVIAAQEYDAALASIKQKQEGMIRQKAGQRYNLILDSQALAQRFKDDPSGRGDNLLQLRQYLDAWTSQSGAVGDPGPFRRQVIEEVQAIWAKEAAAGRGPGGASVSTPQASAPAPVQAPHSRTIRIEWPNSGNHALYGTEQAANEFIQSLEAAARRAL